VAVEAARSLHSESEESFLPAPSMRLNPARFGACFGCERLSHDPSGVPRPSGRRGPQK
jgi:hypothetical protein